MGSYAYICGQAVAGRQKRRTLIHEADTFENDARGVRIETTGPSSGPLTSSTKPQEFVQIFEGDVKIVVSAKSEH